VGLILNLEKLIIENKLCTRDELDQALSIQKDYGGNIGNILLNLGIISEDDLVHLWSQAYDLNIFDAEMDFSHIKLDELNDEFFIENNIYPFELKGNVLKLVSNSPYNASIVAFIEMETSYKVILYISTDENLKEVKNLYIDKKEEEIYYQEEEIDKLKELASEAPIIKLVNNVFIKALNMQASDIHFESNKNGISVRYRVDGKLKTIERVSLSLKQAVIARLKLISKMNISESRLPQDGRITFKGAGRDIDIRASSVPTAFGESFVLRLLVKDNISLNLDDMKFSKENLALLKKLLKKPNGILLTTGPTGSGKTSTLYASLNYINSDDIKIITVEDPVEYQLPNISQIQVNADINYTFANALRSILRQDPDVIMVGEIRDFETASIAIQSALTGHLVLSTLHTNSALGAITRLLDLGVEFFLLKSAIIGVMAQRLVRKLCDVCKVKKTLSKDFLRKHNIYVDEDIDAYEACGCKECNFTGYKGRVAIMEIVPFDIDVIAAFEKDKNFNDINALGYKSLFDIGLSKVIDGETSLEEILRLV